MKIFLSAILFTSCIASVSVHAQLPMGEGIVKPEIKAGTTLYLYSGDLIDDLLHHAAVKDSITFITGQYSTEIGTAPPWFAPELVKLDYDLLHLRAISIGRNWIEVVANNKTGKTVWVDRHAVQFIPWSGFMLEVFSVELLPGIKNPMRAGPAERSAIVSEPRENSLHPHIIKGDWMKVSLPGAPGTVPRLGWIRWKRNGRLLVSYSVLS